MPSSIQGARVGVRILARPSRGDMSEARTPLKHRLSERGSVSRHAYPLVEAHSNLFTLGLA